MAHGPDVLRGWNPDRRALLGGAAGFLLLGALGGPPALARTRRKGDEFGFGPLSGPDENGLCLPEGFRSRVIATSGEPVGPRGYVWHADPDGGACFPARDGGWVYVSNSEVSERRGGVGALRFDRDGELVDAYPILTGTTRNCAGGPTPWGTWLSCEEYPRGRVWECDPFAPGTQGIARTAMGRFDHEAAAVDPVERVVYMTEDHPEGLLYRFRPTRYPDLSAGALEAARVLGDPHIAVGEVRALEWHAVEDPVPREGPPTRERAALATRFHGGEGCWYEGGFVYVTTKGDDRVWRIDARAGTIEIVYERATSATPTLSGVDNVFVTPRGDVFVAEDGGDMEIVALGPANTATPILRLVGVEGSEIAGPALSPDGTRLYFSSQRNPGRTYEVAGPFLG